LEKSGKHGKGVENYYNRDSSSDRKYIAHFKNDYRSGEGKVYKLENNELFYEGTFKNGIIVKGKKYGNDGELLLHLSFDLKIQLFSYIFFHVKKAI
tara:strand:- start:667 stop:954 length:288 start_codon:yes stop_codon:yes gene_type:complete